MSTKPLFRLIVSRLVRRRWRRGRWLHLLVADRPNSLSVSGSTLIGRLTRTARKERGFALLIVVVVLVTLSLMIGAVISATQNFARTTTSRLTGLRLRAALDAGIATISHDLSGTPPIGTSQFVARRTISVAGVAVTIAVRPEVAKVDVNTADPKLIVQLMRISGFTQVYSQRIANEIADWRGPASQPELHDALAADYRSAGRGYVSPHRAFETLADLALLLHGSGDLVVCLAPDVTVFTHSEDVELSAASDRVRQAVAASTPSAGVHQGLSSAGVVSGLAGRPDLYEVTETATDESSQMTLTRQVVLRITGDPRNPVWVLSMMSPAPSAEEARAACERLNKASAG